MGLAEDDYVITGAQAEMAKSPFYQKIREVSAQTPQEEKKSEIRLEMGNYAWGAYTAINIIEKTDEVRVIYCDWLGESNKHNKWREGIVPQKDYQALWRLMEENKVWDLKSDISTASPVQDSATFFLSITKGESKKDLIAYGLFHGTWRTSSFQNYEIIVKRIMEIAGALKIWD